MQYTTKHPLHPQTELVDAKVEIAVSKSIDRVLDRIDNLDDKIDALKNSIDQKLHVLENNIDEKIDTLKNNMDEKFHGLKDQFYRIDNRLSAVETKLGMRNELQGQIRNRFIDYGFRIAWLIFATIFAVLFLYYQSG